MIEIKYLNVGKIILFFILFIIIFNSCRSAQNKIAGTWRLTAEVNSEDPYASRATLKETKIVSDKTLILKSDSTFTSNLSLCNEYNEDGIYLSKGKYTFKRNKNPDKLFWIECPGIYRIHYFSIKNNKLELHFPTFGTGYRIKIFEK